MLVVVLVGFPTFCGAYIATQSGRNPFFTYGFVIGWTLLCGSFVHKLAAWLVKRVQHGHSD